MKTKENKIKELWKCVRTNFIVTIASATPNLIGIDQQRNNKA